MAINLRWGENSQDTEARLARDIRPLRIGARVRFQDRWQGTISAIDVAEDWEVLNVTVTSGILFFRNQVKLPFTLVKAWDRDLVDIDATSFHAFAGEIPPVAAPSRPISVDTPVAHPGARLAGFLVRTTDRRATEALIGKGVSGVFRIPISEVSFEGKVLALGRSFENLAPYSGDEEITQRVHDAIAADLSLTPDDKRSLSMSVESGTMTIGGNVRMPPTRTRVGTIVSAVAGIVGVRNEIVDDIDLEKDIGLAIDKAGFQRHADVYARSNLGQVTLYGASPSPTMTEDIVRAVARVRGVREVKNLMDQRPRPLPQAA
jgi:osmotically-inducible protein OsmY